MSELKKKLFDSHAADIKACACVFKCTEDTETLLYEVTFRLTLKVYLL